MAHVPTEVRQQQFIDAAVTVIARVGVDGATTRRIADEAQAPLATLHYCFRTKENLLWAVFERLAELVRTDIENASSPGQSAVAITTHLLDESIRWAVENPDANRAQLEIWLWAERNDTEFANRLYTMFIEAWKGFLGTAQPPLPEDRLESVTRVVVAMIDGLCMQLVTHRDTEKALREAQTARGVLEAYLGQG